MTVLSFFHNSVGGDRTYESDDFAKHTGTIIGDGVVEGLQVNYTNAYAYTIDVGKAIVMGRSVINDAIISTSIGVPVNGDLYSVVVRMDLTARAASIETILGTVYQDDNAIKQIPLATILVGTNTLTITDKRSYVVYKSNKIQLKDNAIQYQHTLGNLYKALNFREGSDTTGVGMTIGAGGTTIVGGGESALSTMLSALIPDAITEKLILTSDYNVEIWTGMQDVGTNATVGKRFIFQNNGDLNIGGNNVDLTTCTFRYTAASKILEIFHWTGTAAQDVVQLAVGDILYQNAPWTNLTLQGGAQVYSTGTTPQYKKKGGVVFLKGAIKNLTAAGTIIGTLPDGYRPRGTSHNYAMPTSGSQFARWAVNTDGTIKLEAVNTTIAVGDWFPINTCFDAD
jgi:hypothetical protein